MLCSAIRGLCVMIVSAVLVGGAAPALGQDNIPGAARWQYVLSRDGKKVEDGLFLATKDFKIFHKMKQIGTYTQSSDTTEVKMTITSGELKGTSRLRLISKTPPTWEGELVRPRGKNLKMKVFLRKD